MAGGRHRERRERRLVRLGHLSARHPWRFVLAWVLLTVAAFAVAVFGVTGSSLFDRLSTSQPGVPGEAQTARELIAAAEPVDSTVLFEASGVDLRSPAVASAAAQSAAAVTAIDGVASSVNPFVFPTGLADPSAARFVGDANPGSGRFLVVTTLEPGLTEEASERAEADVAAAYDRLAAALPPGTSTAVGSGSMLVSAITDQVERDLRAGEGIALPLSFAVMVVVFGGFVAAGMPIVGAIASIAGGLAALFGFSFVIDLDASVVNVVTLLGLALCIDYGLLVVSRAREELRVLAGGRPATSLTDAEIETALGRTVGSAGRTVFFSGLTVAIALAGLLVFESEVIRAIGAAGVSIVLIALLVGLTLVPALCRLGARRLLGKGTEIAPEEGVFSRLARRVQRAPLLVAAVSVLVLVVLALPTLSMSLTSSGHQLLPVGSAQRDFFDRLAENYPTLSAPAATVVAQTSLAEANRWAQTVRAVPGVTSTAARQLDGAHVAVTVYTEGQPLDETGRAVVERLRADRPAFPTWVGGQAAALDDFTGSIAARAPFAIAVVILATFLLMFLMTGSVVLPLKALVISVLSLGASLGVATFVFQDGHLQGLLGFTSTGALEALIPPLVLAFGFGLSMDYELFLLSRVAEIYRAGASNDRAVELGLQRSGRVITSAALLVVIVFAGFIAGQMLVIKQIGLALTTAVLLDATLVRMLLVPATMSVLGRWNWWAPAPLRRWHAAHGISD